MFSFLIEKSFDFLIIGADSMSPLTASSVDKKKRNRCTWPTCNKKLGLTGKDKFSIIFIQNSSESLEHRHILNLIHFCPITEIEGD